MAVRVSVDVRGVDAVVRRLNALSNVNERLAEIARRLCEIGEPIIRATHGHHARVWSEPTETGYRIVAEGEDVLFIEFGTGDMAGALAGQYDAVPLSVRPGSWSETHAQQYSTQGYWYFGGRRYEYTEPHPSFYDAYVAMRQELPRIAREVFSQ